MSHSENKVVVIGAGIVGLATAREMGIRFPDAEIHVLEKEADIALHQTGHNSGVIHSGIYYKPGSEKATTCREAIRLLQEFCDKHAIRRVKVGKVIAAYHENEFAALDKLYDYGIANGVPGLKKISRAELREIKPAIEGLRALHLPEVEIVDYKAVAAALKKEIEERGGEICLHQKVTKLTGARRNFTPGTNWVLETERGEYAANYLINCAGLYSDEVARLAGLNPNVRIIPFRGEYFYLAPEWAKKIRGLVYVVPDPQFPFLGVHLTPAFGGKVKAGPNAVLALAREGYKRTDINLAELFGMAASQNFWRMAAKYWQRGTQELVDAMFKGLYVKGVQKILPGIEAQDLLPGPTGVRAQAVTVEGKLADDFLYMDGPRSIHVLNAPSPAATAALSIARRISALAANL